MLVSHYEILKPAMKDQFIKVLYEKRSAVFYYLHKVHKMKEIWKESLFTDGTVHIRNRSTGFDKILSSATCTEIKEA
jgi:hypothetical protein